MGDQGLRRIRSDRFPGGKSHAAAKLLGGALLSTMTNGDTGGQVRFLELLGKGLEEVNRHAEALIFFERAIKLAEADDDCGLPFMGYEGKAQALVSLGRPDEAKMVLEDALTKARSQEKRGHEAQLLILLGNLRHKKVTNKRQSQIWKMPANSQPKCSSTEWKPTPCSNWPNLS